MIDAAGLWKTSAGIVMEGINVVILFVWLMIPAV